MTDYSVRHLNLVLVCWKVLNSFLVFLRARCSSCGLRHRCIHPFVNVYPRHFTITGACLVRICRPILVTNAVVVETLARNGGFLMNNMRAEAAYVMIFVIQTQAYNYSIKREYSPWIMFMYTVPIVFSCDQAALRTPLSVCLSVCQSVRLSVCHTFFTMFLSSYHHEIVWILPVTEVMSMQKFKVIGQMSRSHRS